MSKARRKFHLYRWKQNDKVLGYGVTQDLNSRQSEHCREVPGSSIESLRTTTNEAAARRAGRAEIKKYERENGDLPPKNKPR